MSNLKNKWIIKYNKEEFKYREILDYLPKLKKIVNSISKNILSIYICIDKKHYSNQYFIENKPNNTFNLFLEIYDIDKEFLKKSNKIEFKKNIKKININSINLLYPALKSDKRWNSIELPASSLYLGSSLSNNKLNVDITKLTLPEKKINEKHLKYDITGISIFEDLFTEIGTYLKKFSNSYKGFIVGGGPMVTLLPLETAYHMENINLLIRGEAEIIFPKILKLLHLGELDSILIHNGFILNLPGLIVLSDISYINRPNNFNDFEFNINFANENQLKRGLEINISRGCKRNCIFCSKVQGKEFRKIEPDKFESLLISMSKRLDNNKLFSKESRSLNINDDDILQDKEYAKKIFEIIKKNNYKIWGIQTSIQSFFLNSIIDNELINIIDIKNLYFSENPMIWLGTDAFIKSREKKLAKFIPAINDLSELIRKFEDKKIKNIHYWISSDPDTTWDEFIEEYIIIDKFRRSYKYFDILAHAPFLIPYSSTPLNTKLIKSNNYQDQIIYSDKLYSKNSKYDLFFSKKVITKFKNLNKLLSNENIVGNNGFFDYIKEDDRFNSFLTIYNFLKKERIEYEIYNQIALSLKKNEKIIETILSSF